MRFDARHCLGKGIAQSLDHLKQRQIDVADLLAENEVAAVGVEFKNSFEIANEFRYPGRGVVCGTFFCLILLLLVVKDVGDRMVGLSGFIQPIGYGQLQLVRLEAALLLFGYEP